MSCDLIQTELENSKKERDEKRTALNQTYIELVACQRAISSVLQSTNSPPQALFDALSSLRAQTKMIESDILCLSKQITTLEAILAACRKLES